MREYLVVATRPLDANGLGFDVEEALGNVTAFQGRMRLLQDDSQQAWDRLRALVSSHRCLGKQIHDANLIATALASGVTRLVTANSGDFSRFSPEMDIIDLATVNAG